MAAGSEAVEFVDDEQVVHARDGAGAGLLIHGLIEEGGDHEALVMGVGQGLDIDDSRGARVEPGDIQRVAAGIVQAEDAGAFVDDAAEPPVESPQRARMVRSPGQRSPSLGIVAVDPVLEPGQELAEGAGGGISAQLARDGAIARGELADEYALEVAE